MPLVYQHNINETTKLGVWHIAETEDFFLQRVPVKKDVSHPHKRLQHLAGRYLLPELFTDFPLEEIQVADTRKPFLQNEQYHFSISHCGEYAAAIVSSACRVGVDIEKITPKIEKVQHKFVSSAELARSQEPGSRSQQPVLYDGQFLTPDSRLLTLLWSCKEAIYKWYGTGQLDFRKHMQLRSLISNKEGLMEMTFQFSKETPILLTLHARFLDDLALAWLHTS